MPARSSNPMEREDRSPAGGRGMFEDAAVVARCRQGDRSAFGELVQRYQDRLYALCRRLCGNRDDAADLAQEAFVRALTALERFDQKSNFYTWLYRIAVNLALDHRRRAFRRPTRSLDGGSATEGSRESILSRLESDEPSPDAAELSRERQRAVEAALAAIEDEYRTVIVLRDLEGLDYREIGEVLEIPVGTVKSRLYRGRIALRKRLRRAMGEESDDGSARTSV